MRHALLLAATGALFAAGAQAQSPVDIGMAAATKNEVIVVLGQSRKDLRAGDKVFQDQQVRTGRDSATQLLFRDETALTVGPNSQLVLDKAVYDPDKHAGEISVRAVSGAFRFVSGSSPSGSYTIKTPAGTIGIRGTWVDVMVLPPTPRRSGSELDGQGGGQAFVLGEAVVRLIVRRGLAAMCLSGDFVQQCVRVSAGHEIYFTRRFFTQPQRVLHDTLDSMVAMWGGPGDASPASGPTTSPQLNVNSSDQRSIWWLDSSVRRDLQPVPPTPQVNNILPPTNTEPPPPPPPNPTLLQIKARALLFFTILRLHDLVEKKIHSYKKRAFLNLYISKRAALLATQIPSINTREDFRAFRREVRDFRKDTKRLIRKAAHHHYQKSGHDGFDHHSHWKKRHHKGPGKS